MTAIILDGLCPFATRLPGSGKRSNFRRLGQVRMAVSYVCYSL